MKTLLPGLTSAVLALTVLTGCGGDGESESDGGADLASFCAAFDVLNQEGEDIVTAEAGREQVDILAESAPEEISTDAQTARDGYHAVADAIEGAGLPLSALDDPMALSAEEQSRFSTALDEADYDPQALEKAFDDVEAWAGDNCA